MGKKKKLKNLFGDESFDREEFIRNMEAEIAAENSGLAVPNLPDREETPEELIGNLLSDSSDIGSVEGDSIACAPEMDNFREMNIQVTNYGPMFTEVKISDAFRSVSVNLNGLLKDVDLPFMDPNDMPDEAWQVEMYDYMYERVLPHFFPSFITTKTQLAAYANWFVHAGNVKFYEYKKRGLIIGYNLNKNFEAVWAAIRDSMIKDGKGVAFIFSLVFQIGAMGFDFTKYEGDEVAKMMFTETYSDSLNISIAQSGYDVENLKKSVHDDELDEAMSQIIDFLDDDTSAFMWFSDTVIDKYDETDDDDEEDGDEDIINPEAPNYQMNQLLNLIAGNPEFMSALAAKASTSVPVSPFSDEAMQALADSLNDEDDGDNGEDDDDGPVGPEDADEAKEVETVEAASVVEETTAEELLPDAAHDAQPQEDYDSMEERIAAKFGYTSEDLATTGRVVPMKNTSKHGDGDDSDPSMIVPRYPTKRK